jgi:hypothetical protein
VPASAPAALPAPFAAEAGVDVDADAVADVDAGGAEHAAPASTTTTARPRVITTDVLLRDERALPRYREARSAAATNRGRACRLGMRGGRVNA